MSDFLIKLFEIMNNSANYAVLRNFEELPEHNTSRDIDILILKNDFKTLKPKLLQIANETKCRILYTNSDNQFFTIVLGDEKCHIFQLDFQYNFAWMGLDLLDERDVLKERIFNGKVYHLNALYTFLPKYLYSRILGAKYPQKYSGDKQNAISENAEQLHEILNKLSGQRSGLQYWENCGKWKLRTLVFSHTLLRNPWRTITFMLSFVLQYLGTFFYRRGLMISFSGPDGCGKTTVIEMVREKLAVNTPELFHFRPTLLPNLGEVGAKAKVVKEVDRNFDNPHRGKKRGKLNSLIRLAYYSCDYLGGYFVKILPVRWRKHIVFFDRYFTDIIVDGERSSIFLNYKFIAFLRYFLPRCQYNFAFKVEPERILTRKQEISKEAMERIYLRLEYLVAQDKRYFWIDNNGTPQEGVTQILNTLLDNQHKIYERKLSK